MHPWPALQQIAIDLTQSLRAHDRYQRLLDVVRFAIPCDATALLVVQNGTLVPLAVHGLSPQVLGMRFSPAEHPRLRAIMAGDQPVRFPATSRLPDPFDGLVVGAPHALADVHDCLGCPLIAEGKVIGVLTADALKTHAFDKLDQEFLVALGALAGAALHTAQLIETVEALAEQRGLVVKELTRGLASQDSSSMLGVSAAMAHVRREIDTVASTDFAVLISGETGVGKELAARAIHAGSRRRDAPFIQINCAALPDGVIESELFGHVRGAFTGAHKERTGRFGLADGGTIFLDEVGEIPLALQGKLLRVLQEGQYERVGEDRTRNIDVRVIAATNRDLLDAVEAGTFRQDLFYRLSVFPIHIPPLRERLDDVPPLAEHFLRQMNWRDRCHAPMQLSAENLGALQSYHYPGNVRELENIIERAAILSQCFLYKLEVQQILDAILLSEQRKQLDALAGRAPAVAVSAPKIMTYAELKTLERDNVIAALQATNYRIYGAGGAAELLGIKPTTLASRIKALEIPLRPVVESQAK